jgi:hypothetical protein
MHIFSSDFPFVKVDIRTTASDRILIFHAYP